MRVNGILLLFSFLDVCSADSAADQFFGRDDGLLEQQRQDSHVCRKTRIDLFIITVSE